MGWWWRVLNEQLVGVGKKAFVVQLTVCTLTSVC